MKVFQYKAFTLMQMCYPPTNDNKEQDVSANKNLLELPIICCGFCCCFVGGMGSVFCFVLVGVVANASNRNVYFSSV